MAFRLQAPDILKKLIAETAKVYHWPQEQLQHVEKTLREYPWTPEEIGLLEKTIRENEWTPKEIAAIVEAYRSQKLTVGFFVQNSNPKLKNFDPSKFKKGNDSGSQASVIIPGFTQPCHIGAYRNPNTAAGFVGDSNYSSSSSRAMPRPSNSVGFTGGHEFTSSYQFSCQEPYPRSKPNNNTEIIVCNIM